MVKFINTHLQNKLKMFLLPVLLMYGLLYFFISFAMYNSMFYYFFITIFSMYIYVN